MTEERKRRIGQYLERRIREAREWSKQSDFANEMNRGVILGQYPCRIKPIAFIDLRENDRREKQGIRFSLIWKDEIGDSFFSNLDVRIAEKGFVGPQGYFHESCRGGGWPYVSLYAVDMLNECIRFKHVKENDDYLTVQEFFYKRIDLACKKNNGEKLIRNMQDYNEAPDL